MAKLKRQNVRKSKKASARKSKKSYSELEKFAYMLGLVKRGIDKGGNKVTDSYERGKQEPKVHPRKPLI